MAPHLVNVTFPRSRLLADSYAVDDYLLNQLHGVNDNPAEDGLPLRQWILREARAAVMKDAKLTEVRLRPRADKTTHTQFCVQIDE